MTTTVATLEARFTADTSSFDAGVRGVQQGINQTASSLTQKIGGIGQGMSQLGMKLAIPAAAINTGFGLGIKAAIDFESAFAGVIKTVDASETEIAGLRSSIRDMATDSTNPLAGLENAHETLSGIAELGGQLGVPIEGLENFTQTIGGLTLATDLTAESASLMLAQFASVTGMDFSNMDELGSTIVALGNNSATTESSIVQFMQRLGGMGASIGLTQSEIAAVGATLASVGLAPEAGSTAMTQIFNEMITAVAGGGAELESFANVAGISAQEFSNAWGRNPLEALDLLVGGFGDLDEAAQVKALDELNLSGVRTSDLLRRLAGDSDLLTDNVTLANTAWEENVALNDEAQKRLSTTESQLNVFKNTLKDLGISVGDILLPALNSVLGGIQPVVVAISGWVQDNPALVSSVAKLGAVLGVASVGLIVVGKAIAGIAAVTNPVTLALAGLFLVWQTNFLGIKSTLEPIITAMTDSLTAIGDFVGGVVNAFQGEGVTGAFEFFKTNIGGLGDSLIDIWSGVDFVAIGQTLLDGITGIGDQIEAVDWSGVGSGIVSGIGSAIGAIINGGVWIMETLLTPLVSGTSTGAGEADWSTVGEAIFGAIGSAILTVVNIPIWVAETIIGPMLSGMLTEIFSADWGSIAEGLFVAMSLGVSLFVNIPQWVWDGIVNPIFTNIGAKFSEIDWGGTMMSIFDGMAAALPDIAAWVNDKLIQPFLTALGTLDDLIKGAINSAIPNDIGFTIPGVTLPVVGEVFRDTPINIGIPDPFPGYAVGTAWTGSGALSEIAGFVHHQEAVVPHDGMKVIPSPRGLMLEGSLSGGGGGGRQININAPIYVQGVEDPEDFYDKLQRVARARA